MVDRQSAIRLGILPLTQNGFARIVSQHTYPKPLSTAEAIKRLAEQIDRTDHAFWPNDVSLADRAVFDASGILGPNQITDAYLLALAVKKRRAPGHP